MYDDGMIIGMKNNERKYQQIIIKLLKKQSLTAEEMDFLEKKGII